ncbi:carbohydrate esterase family 6 protein, partial [Piromyces sp. E2]
AEIDPNFHVYLGFGQSNMEGQGTIEEQDKVVVERFKMISTVQGCKKRNLGNWYDAIPPLANCQGRLGPMDYFGRTLVENLPEEIQVGVAVVAIAGCDIQIFEKENYESYMATMPNYMQLTVGDYGNNPYDRLIKMGLESKKKGIIKGILLHQGETNTGQKNWPKRVKKIYENILTDLELKADDVPLLVGEVIQSNLGGCCGNMNEIIKTIPNTIPTAYVISSKDLEHQKSDNMHFNSEGYRILGKRYAEKMLELLK